MGIFSGREQGSNEPLDVFIGQKITNPKTFLTPQGGETYIRVYGQTRYADIRSKFVRNALEDGLPFWQGKVVLEIGESTDEGGVSKKAFFIRSDKTVLGEVSEFDRKAQECLDFENATGYVARAVIQDDLIGCLVQLFVDPSNRY